MCALSAYKDRKLGFSAMIKIAKLAAILKLISSILLNNILLDSNFDQYIKNITFKGIVIYLKHVTAPYYP